MGCAHMIDHQTFSCCSFFFLSFLFLLICWYMTPAGECWPEASGKREQLNVAWLISLWRALSKFCTDNEQSAISCFKRAKERGWDSRALQCRFPHNPNFMEGWQRSILSSLNMGQKAKIQSSNGTAGAKSHPDRQCLLYYKQVNCLISSSGYFAQIPLVY